MGLTDNLKRILGPPGVIARQEPDNDEMPAPLEGTRMSLFNSQIPAFWQENGLGQFGNWWWPANGALAERIWVANRCIQMNSQQIAGMSLRFEAPNVVDASEPTWCANPDPEWYPNGISDAIFSIVSQIYGWGYACIYVTDWYATGYPRTWTVLPSDRVTIELDKISGQRIYRIGEEPLDPNSIVQIDRDPGARVHGTSAIRAYAQQCWGLLAAGNQSMEVSSGGIPTAVLKNTVRRLTKAQSEDAQAQWQNAIANRNGAPPVLDMEWDFSPLSFNPQELGLLEVQDFNAKAIATAFGVPAVLLNMAIRWGMTYQNPGSLGEMWWRFELRPTAKRIADALTSQMLPSGQYVWLDASDTYEPFGNPTTGPFAKVEDDPEEAGVLADAPTSAQASPAQTQNGNAGGTTFANGRGKFSAGNVTSIGGTRA